MKSIYLLFNSMLFCVFFTSFSFSQSVTLTDSKLPIVIIEDDVDLPYDYDFRYGYMKIINRGEGEINLISDIVNDAYLDYDGIIGLDISSGSPAKVDFGKKPYNFHLLDQFDEPNPTSLMGLPSEYEFQLDGPYVDKSLIRNVLGNEIARNLGYEAPQTKFCELIYNGDYKGVYVLTETLKLSQNRLNLVNATDWEEDNPSVDDGFLWSVDWKNKDILDGFETKETDRYKFVDPSPEEISQEQISNLKSAVERFEYAIDFNIDYSNYIDTDSWINHFIIQEITKNPNAFGSSTYYYKNTNGKIYMGASPGDLYLALGASYHGFAHIITDYTYNFGHARIGPGYNQQLFENPEFRCQLIEKYQVLRNGLLSTEYIHTMIDSLVNIIGSEAIDRNYIRHDILGRQMWLEAPGATSRITYQDEIDYLKNWITERFEWLDNNLNESSCQEAIANEEKEFRIRVLLEGYMNQSTGEMNSTLSSLDILPNTNPYGVAPYYNSDIVFTNSFPVNTVDWIMIQVRNKENLEEVLEEKILFLRKDGYIMDMTGNTDLSFNTSGKHHIAIIPRAHLSIISDVPVDLENTNLIFSATPYFVKGKEQIKLDINRFVVHAGDFDGNGIINNLDFNLWASQSSSINQYVTWDGDGNGIVNNLDFNLWSLNKSKVGVQEIQY